MPPSNLEFTKINVDNLSENVVPQSANAKFNVRFNTKHKSSSLKKKIKSNYRHAEKKTGKLFNFCLYAAATIANKSEKEKNF